MIAFIAIALAGCTPQDAEVDGQWFVWLPANTSSTVAADELVDLQGKSTVFECSGRGWDDEAEDWDDGYIGPEEDDDPTDPRWIGGDCSPDDSDCDDDIQEEMDEDCDRIDALEYYTEFQDDGYYALTGKIEPWRTEALYTSEGDFQLTVHHDLGDGQDFRFVFSIAPDFAPVYCTDDDNGDPTIEYVDGVSWLDAWSEDEDGYSLYYLNSNGYQIPPSGSETDDPWYMPVEWAAGTAVAKFSSDEFAVNSAPAWAAIDHLNYDQAEYETSIEEANETADLWTSELVEVAGANTDGEPAFSWRVEDNTWREVDTDTAGLDGFVELHSSWVRIKDGADYEPGGSLEGDYQILFFGLEAPGWLLIRGTFKVDNIREDKWGYEVFEDAKRDENGEPFCGGASMP